MSEMIPSIEIGPNNISSFLSETVNFGGITVDSQAITAATISAKGIADHHVQYKVELHKVNSNGTLQPINGPIVVGDDI
ncbi:unnamed protein product, partial [Onchocerca flexuosa]|uniref:Spore germination protein n=1 Tax=Onchocerca flexuosa TaxID=387005 RepID=A0A183HVH7_9BILA